MKRLTSLILVIFLLFTSLGMYSCVRESAPHESPPASSEEFLINTEPEETEADTENTASTAPEEETESETEELTLSVELTEEVTTEEVTTETSPPYVVMEQLEIDVFGNYTPPETTPPAPPEPTYEPSTPSIPSTGQSAPIALMYHLILDRPFTELESLFVRPSELEGHIEALKEKNYTFIFADEYAVTDKKTVIMSFDDGYVDNYTEMFPIIKKYNVKVTVFMIAAYIGSEGYLTSAMIKEMSDSGLVSFQSHTMDHPSLTSLTADSMRYQFRKSNEIIESLTGREVKAICYPTGRYNNTVLAVASEFYDFGYTTVYSTSTAGYPALALPRMRVNRGITKNYFSALIP